MIPDAEVQPLMPLWPDAGRALGLSKWATYAARDRGQLPVHVIGARTFVITAELRRQLGLPVSGCESATTPVGTGAVAELSTIQARKKEHRELYPDVM